MYLNPRSVTTKMVLLVLILTFYTIKTSNSTTSDILHKKQSSVNENLKILSWNIYMLPYIGWFNNNSKRAEAIALNLMKENYDILFFQEAFETDSRNIILKYLLPEYPFQYGPFNPERNYFETNSGLWVLSKISLKLLKSIEFTSEKGYDAISRKGAVLFEGSFKGKQFQILNTHLQADEYNYIRKIQEKHLFAELLHPFETTGIPQIVCGDMNISSHDMFDYYYMIYTYKCENNHDFSIQAVTYNEIENKLAAKKIPRPRSLDYILLRKNESTISVSRKLKKIKGVDFKGSFDLSDHYALEAEIIL